MLPLFSATTSNYAADTTSIPCHVSRNNRGEQAYQSMSWTERHDHMRVRLTRCMCVTVRPNGRADPGFGLCDVTPHVVFAAQAMRDLDMPSWLRVIVQSIGTKVR